VAAGRSKRPQEPQQPHASASRSRCGSPWTRARRRVGCLARPTAGRRSSTPSGSGCHGRGAAPLHLGTLPPLLLPAPPAMPPGPPPRHARQAGVSGGCGGRCRGGCRWVAGWAGAHPASASAAAGAAVRRAAWPPGPGPPPPPPRADLRQAGAARGSCSYAIAIAAWGGGWRLVAGRSGQVNSAPGAGGAQPARPGTWAGPTSTGGRQGDEIHPHETEAPRLPRCGASQHDLGPSKLSLARRQHAPDRKPFTTAEPPRSVRAHCAARGRQEVAKQERDGEAAWWQGCGGAGGAPQRWPAGSGSAGAGG
jgi:hypothetical protein